MKKEYYLCSQDVVEHFPEFERSKPFKSGYGYDKDKDYYVIAIEPKDWLRIGAKYRELEEAEADHNFWAYEVVDSLVSLEDARKFSLNEIKSSGFFVFTEDVFDITKEQNRAYVLYKLAFIRGWTPIEYANKYF